LSYVSATILRPVRGVGSEGAAPPDLQHPQGPVIDVFNFGDGRCRTLPPAPPRSPPSTFSTSVVAAIVPSCQHPQGVRYQRLQLRWWPLSDLPVSTPGVSPSTSSTSVVAAVGPCRQHPRGGPPSMSSTSVVAAVRPIHQHPLGARHRRLQIRWWPLLDLSASTP
jgi:hypothetical protein